MVEFRKVDGNGSKLQGFTRDVDHENAWVLPQDVHGIERYGETSVVGNREVGAYPYFAAEAATACSALAFRSCGDVVAQWGVGDTSFWAVAFLEKDDVPVIV